MKTATFNLIFVVLTIVILNNQQTYSANILAFITDHSRSHCIIQETLLKAFVKRGHNDVCVSQNVLPHLIQIEVGASAIVLIVTGAIIFLIASLGCYGAIRESPTMLYAFAFLLLIIFVIELAVGIAACVFKSDLQMMLQKSLQNSIERSSMDDIMAWDNVQQRLMCCGINGPSDWSDYSRNRTIRSSCCRPQFIDGSKDCLNNLSLFQHRYYQDGCLLKLKAKIDSNAVVLIEVGLGLAFIQLLGIVLACWLASAIRRENAK